MPLILDAQCPKCGNTHPDKGGSGFGIRRDLTHFDCKKGDEHNFVMYECERCGYFIQKERGEWSD